MLGHHEAHFTYNLCGKSFSYEAYFRMKEDASFFNKLSNNEPRIFFLLQLALVHTLPHYLIHTIQYRSMFSKQLQENQL